MFESVSRRKAFRILFTRGFQVLVGTVSGSLLSCQPPKIMSFGKYSRQGGVELLNESGKFLSEVKKLKKLALPKNSNLYQPPTTNDLESFKILANALISLDIDKALNKASDLNYEVVRFVDTPTQQVFYGLRERRIHNYPLRGWGSYFINASYKADALIEIPHILFDLFSEEIGAKVFLMSAARGVLISGAHRNANGAGTADVCNPIKSIFQEVHKAWVLSKTKTWQIHGFSISTKSKLPVITQSVLSSGQSNLSTEVLDLSKRMNNRGFLTHIYNKLSGSTFLNQLVNQSVAGTAFSHLGATKNIQGIYCRSVGNPFIHVELDKSIRFSTTRRDRVARVIADSIKAVT